MRFLLLLAAASTAVDASSLLRRGLEEQPYQDDWKCEGGGPKVHDRRFVHESKTLMEYDALQNGFVTQHYPAHLKPGTMDKREDHLFTQPLQNADLIIWDYDKTYNTLSLYNDETTLLNNPDQDNYIQKEWNLVSPDTFADHDWNAPNRTVVIESQHDIVAYIGIWFDVYQHLLIDHLGYLAYLRQTLPEDTKLLMPEVAHNPILRRFLTDLDPDLERRVLWVTCESVTDCHRRVQIRGEGSLRLLRPTTTTRHGDLYRMARQWLNEVYPIRPSEPTVIYYQRLSDDTYNGRVMDQEQEVRLKDMITSVLSMNHRPETLVVFDGHDVTFQEQIDLFRSATVVLGPHGGGLANVLFALNHHGQCPKMMEFVTSSDTPNVMDGSFWCSYLNLYSTVPWLEYHIQFFQEPSNDDVTRIDEDLFLSALQELLPDPTHSTTK